MPLLQHSIFQYKDAPKMTSLCSALSINPSPNGFVTSFECSRKTMCGFEVNCVILCCRGTARGEFQIISSALSELANNAMVLLPRRRTLTNGNWKRPKSCRVGRHYWSPSCCVPCHVCGRPLNYISKMHGLSRRIGGDCSDVCL